MNAESSLQRQGLLAGFAAFFIWGLLPLYLYALHAVSPWTIIAHRLLWSCVFVFAFLAWKGQLGGVRAALRQPALLRRLSVSAALISFNWLLYVWAVSGGHVVESSLGYFINPLFNVLLGVLLLGERLNPRQWGSVALAAAGVLWLGIEAGRPPWIALALGLSFALYGFVRKKASVDAVAGLAVETLLLTPIGLGWLLWAHVQGGGVASGQGAGIGVLLVLGGVITAVPLALFAFAARSLPYSTVGLLQYIAPSLQLIIGLLVFGEPFSALRALGFALIWLALIVFAADGLWRQRQAQLAAAS